MVAIGSKSFSENLGVYNAVILFILEPDLIDNGLYERGTKYACFQIRILDVVNCQQQ